MAFNTPFVRMAAAVGTAANCPDATSRAAFVVDQTKAVETWADVAPGDRTVASALLDKATPRRVNRLANSCRALASLLESVPSDHSSRAAASLRLLPSRWHNTMGV